MKQEIIKCVREYMRETVPLKDTNMQDLVRRMLPCPMPQSSTERKYIYFYNAYNHSINTRKYMSFETADKPVC